MQYTGYLYFKTTISFRGVIFQFLLMQKIFPFTLDHKTYLYTYIYKLCKTKYSSVTQSVYITSFHIKVQNMTKKYIIL